MYLKLEKKHIWCMFITHNHVSFPCLGLVHMRKSDSYLIQKRVLRVK